MSKRAAIGGKRPERLTAYDAPPPADSPARVCAVCGSDSMLVTRSNLKLECVWCLRNAGFPDDRENEMKVPEKSTGSGTDGYGKPYDKNTPAPPPHPAGTANAVIVDYIDMGMCEREVYGKPGVKESVHLAKFVVQSGKTMPDGRRYLLAYKPFGVLVSLHEKAGFRLFLESINGEPFKVGDEIEPESFVGRPCIVIVAHKASSDGTKTYANIASAGPHMEGLPVLVADGYVRVKDRDQKPANEVPDDTDIPF